MSRVFGIRPQLRRLVAWLIILIPAFTFGLPTIEARGTAEHHAPHADATSITGGPVR